jgi:hypothetical protein
MTPLQEAEREYEGACVTLRKALAFEANQHRDPNVSRYGILEGARVVFEAREQVKAAEQKIAAAREIDARVVWRRERFTL